MQISFSILRYTVAAAALFVVTGCGGGGSSDSNGSGGQNGANNSGFTTAATQTVTENNSEVTVLQTKKLESPVFTITGGADANKFEIDPQSGVLKFKEAPDFENPTDADHNNSYIVIVKAQDASGKTASETITVTVTNDATDDGPLFTSPDHATVTENRQLDFSVAANGAVSYKINGEDAKAFQIDTDSGKLTFANFLPDFERPSDKNHDNQYVINVIAGDDHNFTSRQVLTVFVTNDPSDDATEAQWVHIYKTGADDGVVSGAPFGADRSFSAEKADNDNIVKVGKRTWQDAPENASADYTYGEAEDYCNNLDYAGQSDWRVPNRHELSEIVNYGKSHSSNPTIDDIFQNVLKGNYWTKEEVIGHAGNVLTNEAFVVNFTDGVSYALDRGTKSGVRCVRGEQLVYKDYINKDADDIYRDPKTGFMWAKPAGPESMPQAKERCESLVFGGYDDWRLPNINELHTIMPSVIDQDPGHPYGAEPLLREGAHQLWSATKINETDAIYLDNYWNNEWGGSEGVAVDGDHPLGRDRMNDALISADNANSVFSICIRGGHL